MVAKILCKKIFCYWALLAISLTPALIYFWYQRQDAKLKSQFIQENRNVEEEINSKWILFWNLPTNNFNLKSSELRCGNYECFISNKSKSLRYDSNFDVIIFYINSAEENFANRRLYRDPSQLYILASREPPNTDNKFEDLGYNMTMTYRLDSDIPWVNYRFIDIKTTVFVAPKKGAEWTLVPKAFINSTDLWDFWNKKTTQAAMWVEQCSDSNSMREQIIKDLKNFIPIDIYGPCDSQRRCVDSISNCQELFDRNYKFYLAFEESLCPDLVSDDVFIAMNHSMLPIVFGGSKYDDFLPPESFIDVETFGSTEIVGDYIVELGKDPIDYFSYFWWQSQYRIAEVDVLCELCTKAWKFNGFVRSQVYNDLENWWNGGTCRKNMLIKY